ncbi:hypothetical protein C8F04DRAFT_1182822 [Mycena alexandri]|uniref:Uncharacterized protein n=1 Tax=Mycena alexandri TaxID=1745969 RepID=A0AAD6SXE3_9AGAR|nr:hypothetical protein C8F04DRAFT_1182822 [Mycena alexandri]
MTRAKDRGCPTIFPPGSAAGKLCWSLRDGDTHGISGEDIRKKMSGMTINFTSLSDPVFAEFAKYGDIIQSAYRLYEPLLRAGVRLLHYVGAQDANCAPAGIMSFLKLLQSPFQEEFLRTPDVPWPTNEDATIAHDQPELVKSIVEHWVKNVPFD